MTTCGCKSESAVLKREGAQSLGCKVWGTKFRSAKYRCAKCGGAKCRAQNTGAHIMGRKVWKCKMRGALNMGGGGGAKYSGAKYGAPLYFDAKWVQPFTFDLRIYFLIQIMHSP